MKNFVKKAVVVATPVVGALPVLAEGETTGELIITGAQTALNGLLTAAGTAVVAILLAGLAIWGGIAIVGILKRAFGAGKGR